MFSIGFGFPNVKLAIQGPWQWTKNWPIKISMKKW
jgi:hypothetical protein